MTVSANGSRFSRLPSRMPSSESGQRSTRRGSSTHLHHSRKHGKDDFLVLPELMERFGDLGFDVVEIVLADQDRLDRYQAAQWFNLRRWLDDNPDASWPPRCGPNSLPNLPATRATSANTWVGEFSH